MKTVSGEIISTRPVSLANASKILLKFVTVDNGASHAISIYLRKASEAFDELNQFHKGLRTSNSDRKSRKSSSLAESFNSSPRETQSEDGESDQRKRGKKKAGDAGGLVEANEDSRRTVEQELANGDGKVVGSEGEKKRHKSKDRKLKDEDGNVVKSIAENGEAKSKDGKTKDDADGEKKMKKKKKKKGGDVSAGMGENGTVEEDRKGGKKRKIEVTGEGREEVGSTEHRSKKKKRT